MMLRGHGIDIVDIDAFSRLLNEPTGDFISRCFTVSERTSITNLSASNREQALAGKYAAKEAVVKALRLGFNGTTSPLDIEISHDSNGAPEVLVKGATALAASTLGISSWRLSISHAGNVAIASVMALG